MPDENNPGGYGPWTTGGISFDTRGIKEFVSEMGKAQKAVENFWTPFKDTKKAQASTNDFFKNLKKQLKELEASGAADILGGPGGGKGSRSLGGDSKFSNPGPTKRLGSAFSTGLSDFRDARNPAVGAGQETMRTALGQGVRSFFGGQGGLGARGAAALGMAAVHFSERYVDANTAPAVGLQSAANWAIQSQSQGTRGWSTGYRDSMADTLARQGLSPAMQGAFTGRQDVAGATQTAMRSGLQVTQGGQGRQLGGAFKSAGVVANLTGMTGTEAMGVVAGMQNPQNINTMRAFGISARPGGKPQDITRTYGELANYIFGPLGRKATKEEVRLTLRSPGTQAYLIVQQAFGGDEQQIEAFIRWVEASSPSSKGGKSRNILGQEDLEKAGVTGTTATRLREGGAASEKRKAEADKGMLRGVEQAVGVTEDFNQALGKVTELLGPFADAITGAIGFLGQMGNSMPGHGGGGQGGGLLGNIVSGLVMGNALKGAGGLIGKIPGVGGLLSKIPGLAGGGGAGGIAGLAARAVGGGAIAWGGNKLGQGISSIGRRDGDANDWAKAGGTVAKWGAAGAGIGTMIAPGVGTAIGGGVGLGVGAVHAGGRALIENADKVGGALKRAGSWVNPFGDPIGTWGWRPYEQGDMGDAEEAASNAGGMTLRGPGRVQGMNSDFVSRLARMFADNPKLSLTSGFRTRAEQEKLYREKPNLAAKPGSSRHEKGLAADIGPRSEYGWIAKNYAKYGLSLPMPQKEPWHVQPDGGVAGGAIAATDASAAASGEDGGAGGGVQGISSVTAGGGLGGPTLGQGAYVPLAGGAMNVAPHRAAAAKAGAKGITGGDTGGSTGVGGVNVPAAGALSIEQALRLAKGAGLGGTALQMAVAIAMGESGLRADAQGDQSLMDNKWGPSVGLWQVRTLKGETGKGTNRDIQALLADPNFQAKAMASISGGGKNWQPWSIYTSGAYQKNMAPVRSVMSEKGIGDPVSEQSGRPPSTIFMQGPQGGGGGSVTIHNLTIPVQIARGTPDEAERAARMIGNILTDRNRLLEIARS